MKHPGCTVFVGALFALTPGAAVADQHPAPAGTGQSVTRSLQGGGPPTCDAAMLRGFYDITVEAFASGPDKVDLEAYTAKTFAHMHAAILAQGGTAKDADAWNDHIKDIPRQLIGIVKDDPRVLDSCANLSLALSGPP